MTNVPMIKAKSFVATLLFLLIAAPVAQAAGGPFDLTAPLQERLQKAVERAQAADAPAQKRLILSEAFRDMSRALDRTKQIPGLSGEKLAALNGLQQDIREQDDRLNGLNGFAPVPSADLDRFGDNVQASLINQSITIGIGTLLLIIIIIILLA